MNSSHDPEAAATNTAMTDRELTRMRRRSIVSSFIGTVIEWFDFYIYGFAAATVFNTLFFPNFAPLTGTLAAFAAFAAGFIARPFGGILWGHFGDRIGRKQLLVLSLLLMGVSTTLVGALPTYAQIGILAPLLLTLLRIVQGLAAGGEWGGSILIITEYYGNSPRRGLWSAVAMVGNPTGVAAAIGVNTLLLALPEQALMSWGWRIPFLFSIVLTGIGLFIRFGLTETPTFQEETQRRRDDDHASAPQIPLVELVHRHPRNMVLGILLVIGPFLASGVYLNFGVAYANEVGLPSAIVPTGLLLAQLMELILIPVGGALSDYFGRRPVYMAGAVLLGIGSFLIFPLLGSAQGIALVFIAFFTMLLPHAILYGTMGSFLTEQFGTATRYTGMSIGYQVAGTIGGGLSPSIAIALFILTGGTSTLYVSLMVVIACALTFIAAFVSKETYRINLSEEPTQGVEPAQVTSP